MTQDNANHDAVPAAITVSDEDCTVAIQNGTFYADDEPLFAAPCTPLMQTTSGTCSKPREGT